MVEITCPVCSSDESSVLLTGQDHICGDSTTFRLVRCASCGLVYLNPRPDAGELSDHYAERYRQWQSVPATGLAARFRALGSRRKAGAVAGLAGAGRLLDVGCGFGDFLLSARKCGFEPFGTELEPDQARRAAAASGADVRAGEPDKCSFEPGSFDVVTMWHVLEHMEDPLGTLRAVRSLLKPGGLAVVAVPDAGSWAARLFGGYWAGYDMPRHLLDFSRQTLEATLARAGFRTEQASYFMGTFDNVRISLEFLIQGEVRNERLRSLLLKLVSFPLIRVALTPAALILQRLGKGSVVTCFARAA